MQWPPNYVAELDLRQKRLITMCSSRDMIAGARTYYSERSWERCCEFIEHWGVTYDPRNAGQVWPDGTEKLTTMPFIMFPKQRELVRFILDCLLVQADGLDEKCRDMGATWICVGVTVWLWAFWDGASIGWGSRKLDLVDKIGDADSIFEKLRIFIRNLPAVLLPPGFSPSEHMNEMKIINGAGGASITGEVGDNIGRGGRKLIYFKDESAHYEHPELVEAALGDNTNCQIDVSSVHGLGNVFHRKREAGLLWQPGAGAIRGKTNVFVMDWRDHPAKDELWWRRRHQSAIDNGLLHVFEQEVNRNYAASVQGAIIQGAWIKAAIGAHLNPALASPEWEAGPWSAALDVADSLEGTVGDRNALTFRKGVVLREANEWGELDPGVTARKSVGLCQQRGRMSLQYDCIGIGASVKSETNRLEGDGLMPKDLTMVPWNAGLPCLHPDDAVNSHDDSEESPLNKDFFQNLKAQGWWQLAMRFLKTWRCVEAGKLLYPVSELISLDPELPLLRQIEKELAQPTRGQSGNMRMMVNKAPKGTKSPNLGDSIMMNYWPVVIRGPIVVSDGVLERSRQLAMAAGMRRR